MACIIWGKSSVVGTISDSKKRDSVKGISPIFIVFSGYNPRAVIAFLRVAAKTVPALLKTCWRGVVDFMKEFAFQRES